MLLSTRPFLFSLLVAVLALQSSALPDAEAHGSEHRHAASKGQMQAAISTIRSHYGKDYGAQIMTFCNNLLQSNETQPTPNDDSTSSPLPGTQPGAGVGSPGNSADPTAGSQGQSAPGSSTSDNGDPSLPPVNPPATATGGQSEDGSPGIGEGTAPMPGPETEQPAFMGGPTGPGALSERSLRSNRSKSRGDRRAKAKTQYGKGRKLAGGHGHHKVSQPGIAVAKAAAGGALFGGAAGSLTGLVADTESVPTPVTPPNAMTLPGAVTPPNVVGAAAGAGDGSIITPTAGDGTTSQGSNNATSTISNGPSGPTSSDPGSSANNQTLPEFVLPPFLRHVDQSILKQVCQLVVNSTLPGWTQPTWTQPTWTQPTPYTDAPRPTWWTPVVGNGIPTHVNGNGHGTWPSGTPWWLPTVTVTVTETVTVTATPTASATP